METAQPLIFVGSQTDVHTCGASIEAPLTLFVHVTSVEHLVLQCMLTDRAGSGATVHFASKKPGPKVMGTAASILQSLPGAHVMA